MNLEKLKVKDSFGARLYENDIIEYYDHCFAAGEVYFEEGYTQNKDNYPIRQINKLPSGYEDRAIKKGFTCKELHLHDYKYVTEEASIKYFKEPEMIMRKPLIGVVKWNKKNVTYEPIINTGEEMFSFFVLIENPDDDEGTKTYCKKIGNMKDNPELLIFNNLKK